MPHLNILRVKSLIPRIREVERNLNKALPYLEEGKWPPAPTSNSGILRISRMGGDTPHQSLFLFMDPWTRWELVINF